MKKSLSSLLLLFVTACASGGSVVTMGSFYDVPIGATDFEVVASFGEPSTVRKKTDGVVEYEYVERIKAGARDLEERRYIITLKDGKVISKHVKQSSPAPYRFDSYEMQTTHNDEDESAG